MKEKGIALVISLAIIAVLLILTGVYFSGLIAEKRSVDNERYVLQALNLAEAGLNYGLAYFKDQVRCSALSCAEYASECLKCEVNKKRQRTDFNTYVSQRNPLALLADYGSFQCVDERFPDSQPLACSDSRAEARITLSSTAASLGAQIGGDYTVRIKVKPDPRYSDGVPHYNPFSSQENFYEFFYKFLIEAQGRATRTTPPISKTTRFLPAPSSADTLTPEEGDTASLAGHFKITVRRDTFAKFALFTAHHSTPSGTTVWFTGNTNFTGPVHTNQRFSFANNPSGHFTEDVTQHEKKARFYNAGWPVLMDADSNPPRDVPVFDKGFKRGQDLINLESSLSQADLKREALGGGNEPLPNGIYVVNDGANITGGIYIRGNQGQSADDAVIAMAIAANGPVYTLRQGTGATTTVTLDYAANTTTVSSGSTSNQYAGIPDGQSNEGILIYANDDIGGFSGTVQSDTRVTVSAEKDIVISNHIQYENFTPDDPATPAINELSASGQANLLGILSWGGDVRIGSAAPNNLQIHGVVMAEHGEFTVDRYNQGSPRGTATLLGGAITDFYGPFGTFSGTTQLSGYGRNFVYDARMLQGAAPPYFPYMLNFTSFDDGGLNYRMTWQDQGG
jgi:hypothetical protein